MTVSLRIPVFYTAAVLHFFSLLIKVIFFFNSTTEKSYSAVSRENTSWIKFEVIFGCTFFLYVQQHAHTNLISQLCPLCCLNALIPSSSAIFHKSCRMRMCRGNSPYRPNTETTCIPSQYYSVHAASCLQTPLVVTSWLSRLLVCGTLKIIECLTLTSMLLSDLNIRWWLKRE